MAKKSREERRQIRRKGWKDFFTNGWKWNVEGIKSLPGVVSTAGMLIKAAKGDIPGAALSGANAAVGLTHGIASQKAYASMLGGLWKGIFNHPSWYAFEGNISLPAYNADRPFDPGNVRTAMGGFKSVPGIGVTHVIQQNVIYEDVMDCEFFKLAAMQAFKDIRMMLKSNLPYTEEDYRRFVSGAIAILVKCIAIERTLGWYNVVRPDIPELQDALLSVSVSPTEKGRVRMQKIKMLESYSESLAVYRKLQTVVAEIGVPSHLVEFVSWWLGGSFIDQAAQNPQLYVNMLRSAPIYTYTSASGDYTMEQIGTFDIATSSVQDVVDEALDFLQTFSMMNADIGKTRAYGRILLRDVGPGYQTTVMQDFEFFSILINNYTLSRDDPRMAAMFSREYVRADFMEELSPANTVGVCNALATWADATVPMRIVSQNAYFTMRNGMQVPHNAVGIITASEDPDEEHHFEATLPLYDSPLNEKGFFYQFDSDMEELNHYTVGDLDDKVVTVTSTQKLSAAETGSYSSIKFVTPRYGAHEYDLNVRVNGPGTYTENVVLISQSVSYVLSLDLSVTISDAMAISDYSVKLQIHSNAVTTTLATLTSSWHAQLNRAKNAVTFRPPISGEEKEISGTHGEYDVLIPYLKVGTRWTAYGAAIAKWYLYSSSTSEESIAYDTHSDNWGPLLVEQIDYHLPVLYWHGTLIETTRWVNPEDEEEDPYLATTSFKINNAPALLKECYVPVIMNYDDMSQVLYWMYLGLFSLKTRYTPPRPRDGAGK